jgi:hypothetical protein
MSEPIEKWLEVLQNLGAAEVQPVESSSQVRGIGYNDQTKTLFVAFKPNRNGQGIYSYDEVPREVYEAFLRADSIGKFFGANVQKSFAYHRLGTINGEQWLPTAFCGNEGA